MMFRLLVVLCLSLFLLACDEQPLMAVGQLESDRVEVITESSEPIVSIGVKEGDEVAPGNVLLQQDTQRLELRIEEARANISRIQAQLEEQLNGPRQETIAATRAILQEAIVERDFRERDLQRLAELRARNLTSVESVDTAESRLDAARARIDIVQAQLAELEAGTRVEQIEQTRSSLAQAQTQLGSLQFDLNRLTLASPVLAVVDSLPFEVGERPRQGDVVAVLLTGEQPYARVYIPEPLRVQVRVGDELDVHVDGLPQAIRGSVRRISAEASFTPYFALTERDRSRLAYLAEVSLLDSGERLPEGVPVQILFE